MSKKFPKFGDCHDCGKTEVPETSVFKVPTCPEEIKEGEQSCVSHEGKFYDKLTKDLIIPPVGKVGSLSLCSPKLWATCQWLAVCYGVNKLAIFKVTGVNVNEKTLDIYNGCDNGEITDNPAPGTVIKSGSVFFPVPPAWCGESFCNKISSIIADGDCACKGVLACLQGSDEICLTSIPTVEEDENISIIGTVKGEGTSEEAIGLWDKCLRLVDKIWVGLGGKSFCFLDLPETDDTPIEEESKNFVYILPNGCLAKGREVDGTQCSDDLDLQPPESEDPACNCTTISFDKLWGCKNGERVLIPPTDENQIIKSCKNDSDVLFWTVEKGGMMDHYLDTPQELFASYAGSGTIPKTLDEFPTPSCSGAKIRAIFKYVTQGYPDGSATPNQSELHLNAVVFDKCIFQSGNNGTVDSGQVDVPVEDADVNFILSQVGTSVATTLHLLGYKY